MEIVCLECGTHYSNLNTDHCPVYGCNGALVKAPEQLSIQMCGLAECGVYVVEASMPNVMIDAVMQVEDARSRVVFAEPTEDKEMAATLRQALMEKSAKFSMLELHESVVDPDVPEEEQVNTLMLFTVESDEVEARTEANAQLVELMCELFYYYVNISDEEDEGEGVV